MLLHNTLLFSWLRDCRWKNITLQRRNTNTLTSACGLGLENITLSAGAAAPHPGAETANHNSGRCAEGAALGSAADCTQAGEICLILAEGEN